MQIRQDPINDQSTFRTGRSQKITLGVKHFVSARYFKGYEDKPFDIDGNIKLFKELGPKYKFGCPFLLGRDGEVVQLGKIEDTHYQAGKSFAAFPEYTTSVNSISVGVEWIGMTGELYTDKQYVVGGELAAYIESEVIKKELGEIGLWVGHDWIAGQAAVSLGIRDIKKIKVDPGPLFDWKRFYTELYRNQLKKDIKIGVENDIKTTHSKKLSEYSGSELFGAWLNKLRGK